MKWTQFGGVPDEGETIVRAGQFVMRQSGTAHPTISGSRKNGPRQIRPLENWAPLNWAPANWAPAPVLKVFWKVRLELPNILSQNSTPRMLTTMMMTKTTIATTAMMMKMTMMMMVLVVFFWAVAHFLRPQLILWDAAKSLAVFFIASRSSSSSWERAISN